MYMYCNTEISFYPFNLFSKMSAMSKQTVPRKTIN